MKHLELYNFLKGNMEGTLLLNISNDNYTHNYELNNYSVSLASQFDGIQILCKSIFSDNTFLLDFNGATINKIEFDQENLRYAIQFLNGDCLECLIANEDK